MNDDPDPRSPPVKLIERYALYGEIAAGGMATVHIGRLLGPVGFSRTVAIKRLLPQLARDPEFVAMFLDEARLAARIRHPNVVSTLDVVAADKELFLVMDYIHGESLARVWRSLATRGERIPPRIAAAVLVGALTGLHAAHDATDERGAPLGVVHRDVSPQNIMIGADGIARVLDFGVAKAAGRIQQTREGQLKGKLSYMAPEQYRGEAITRSVDIYAASIVLWEALTGRRLFGGNTEAAVVERVLYAPFQPPSEIVPGLPPGIDALLERGLARDAAERFSTARDMAMALEGCLGVASMNEVATWLADVAGAALEERADVVAAIESASGPGSVALAMRRSRVSATPAEATTKPQAAAEAPTKPQAGAATPTKPQAGADEVSNVSATVDIARRGGRRALLTVGAAAVTAILAAAALRVLIAPSAKPAAEQGTASAVAPPPEAPPAASSPPALSTSLPASAAPSAQVSAAPSQAPRKVSSPKQPAAPRSTRSTGLPAGLPDHRN